MLEHSYTQQSKAKLKLAVSILAADFSRLGDELRQAEAAGAHYAHIDVMDGHFVPNISIGIPVVESLRKCSNLVFDVHLMITNPEDYINAFAEAGADIINFHIEATSKKEEVVVIIEKIRALGKKPAITLNPNTPVEAVTPYLHMVEMVLVMSVFPGFGGQQFIPEALDRVRVLRNYIDAHKLNTLIEIDGGIKLDNVRKVVEAGVDVVVAGSAVFGAGDNGKAVASFLNVMNGVEQQRNWGEL